MGDWLWIAIPGVLIAGGWVGENVRSGLRTRHERRLELAEATERSRLASDAANRPPEPVCGCTHHLAKHDVQGRCHEAVEAPTAWDAERKPLRYEARTCNCQQYIGPEPLGTVFAAGIVDVR